MKAGLALLNALVTLLFTKSPKHNGMAEEDEAVCPFNHTEMSLPAYMSEQFRLYLEEHGYDTSRMGLLDSTTTSRVEVGEKTDASSENEKV